MRYLLSLIAIACLQSTGCNKSDPAQPASGNEFNPISEDALIGTWVCIFREGSKVDATGYFTWEFRDDRTLVQDYPPEQSNQNHTFGWALGSYENRESLLLIDVSPGPSGIDRNFEQSVIRLDGDELTLWFPGRTDEGRLDYPGLKSHQFRRK